MSFSDPQSWDDVDFAGNTEDWSTRKNKLLYPAYEKLRKALVERCQASGTTVPAILDDTNPVGQNQLVSYEWKDAFQSTITAIIPYFVNHTDNDGDWAGQITIPNWTEADILTAIGENERIPIFYIFSSAWEIQQYNILNLLRWRVTYPVGSDGAYVNQRRKYVENNSTYSAAETAFDSASYISNATAIGSFHSQLYLGDYRITMDDCQITAYAIGTARIIQLYAACSTITWDFTPYTTTYSGKILLLEEIAESNVDETSQTTYDRFRTSLVYPPEPTAATPEYYNSISHVKILNKFDGPNGFQFRDW